MTTMLTIHCSSLPRALRCPASLQAPEIEIDGSGEAAQIGRAAHEALADLVRNKPVDLGETAKRYGVPEAQVGPLFHIGRRAWDEYGLSMNVRAVEERMSAVLDCGTRLMGTGDIIATTEDDAGTCLVVWDWKSGQPGGEDYRDQLIGYAFLARRMIPAKRFKAVICWLREQSVEIEDVTEAEVDALQERIARAVAQPTRFSPGYANCRYCPRSIDCPARTAIVQQSVLDLKDAGERMDALAPAALAALYPKAKLLRQVLDQYDEKLREAVKVAGSLPMGDGRALTMQERHRVEIDSAAWFMLIERLGVDRAIGAIEISKTALMDMVRNAAPRGQKAAAAEALKAELQQAGAWRETPYLTLVISKEA